MATEKEGCYHWLVDLVEFEREAPRDLYLRVHRMVYAAHASLSDHDVEREHHLIDGLCQHFPGFAPAIRGVALHLQSTLQQADEEGQPPADACAESWDRALEEASHDD